MATAEFSKFAGLLSAAFSQHHLSSSYFSFFSFLESRFDLAQKMFEYLVVQTLISSRNKVWIDSGK